MSGSIFWWTWLWIGWVSAYDAYLSIELQATLSADELNPLGRWLIAADHGAVGLLVGVKFAGTVAALGLLALLHARRPSLARVAGAAVAAAQLGLLWYLSFGG